MDESICYVDTVEEIDLTEFASFRIPDADLSAAQKRFRFLATRCVLIGDDYWVKDRRTNQWASRNKTAAKAQLFQDWDGHQDIGKNTIESFFTELEFLVLDQTLVAPNAPDFVWFESKKCLNLGCVRPLAPDDSAVDNVEFQLLMRLLWENLLNQPPASFDEMLGIIFDDTPSLAKWVFHWLGSCYQRQGKHLPTTLWFIGTQQGVGKTLFVSVLKEVLGGKTTEVSLGELTSGWSDYIEGSTLIVGDEIQMDSKAGFNDFIKKYVGNSIIPLRRRHQGQYSVPNISNWLFTTNTVRPIAIDQDDRRNCFVGTTEALEARELAKQFGRLSRDGKRRASQGFAALLAQIEIDDAFIQEAFWSDLKEQMAELNQKPLHQFMLEWADTSWPIGTFMPGRQLYEHYKTWANDNEVYAGQISKTNFDTQTIELANRGLISKKFKGTRELSDGSRPRGYVRLDPNRPGSVNIKTAPEAMPVQQSRMTVVQQGRMIRSRLESGGGSRGPVRTTA